MFVYDVGVVAFPYWLNPERLVHGSPNARTNCLLSKAQVIFKMVSFSFPSRNDFMVLKPVKPN
jgi:hypothetical protein